MCSVTLSSHKASYAQNSGLLALWLKFSPSVGCRELRVQKITQKGLAQLELLVYTCKMKMAQRSSRRILYDVWYRAVQRCHNSNDYNFRYWGARGITVCDRWRFSFDQFVLDVTPRPSADYQFDRIDNNGNYEPDNWRWATRKQQRANQRRPPRIKKADLLRMDD